MLNKIEAITQTLFRRRERVNTQAIGPADDETRKMLEEQCQELFHKIDFSYNDIHTFAQNMIMLVGGYDDPISLFSNPLEDSRAGIRIEVYRDIDMEDPDGTTRFIVSHKMRKPTAGDVQYSTTEWLLYGKKSGENAVVRIAHIPSKPYRVSSFITGVNEEVQYAGIGEVERTITSGEAQRFCVRVFDAYQRVWRSLTEL